MERPTCETCVYWDERSGGAGEQWRYGNCRRRSPASRPDTSPPTAYPTTAASHWCGDHPGMAAYAVRLMEEREAFAREMEAEVGRLNHWIATGNPPPPSTA